MMLSYADSMGGACVVDYVSLDHYASGRLNGYKSGFMKRIGAPVARS